MGAACLNSRTGWNWSYADTSAPQCWQTPMVCRVWGVRQSEVSGCVMNEGWMHAGKQCGLWGALLMLLTSLNLGYAVPQRSGHLPMRKQTTKNFQPRQRLAESTILTKKGMGGYYAFVTMGKEFKLLQRSSQSHLWGVWHHTELCDLGITLKYSEGGDLSKVEINLGTKFKDTWVMGDRVTCTTCQSLSTFPPFPCTSPRVTALLFLYWHHRVLFVLWWDGEVVRPAGGQWEGQWVLCTQRWAHKKRQRKGRGTGVSTEQLCISSLLCFPRKNYNGPFKGLKK